MARKNTSRWIVADGCVTSSKTKRSILALSADKFVVTTPHTGECVTVDAAGIAALSLQRPAALAVQAIQVTAPKTARKADTELVALKKARGLARARQVNPNIGETAKKAAKKAERSLTIKINKLVKASA